MEGKINADKNRSKKRKDDEMKKLTCREELFCRIYAFCRNGREAAFKAGYKVCPEVTARKLLARSAIREMTEKIRKETVISADEVRAGLHRIAFSSSADAVKLIFSENAENMNFEELDLFNVSEIKRPKGGGVEIKFFDRIKALEKLGEISDKTAENSSAPFFEALERSAAALSGDEK